MYCHCSNLQIHQSVQHSLWAWSKGGCWCSILNLFHLSSASVSCFFFLISSLFTTTSITLAYHFKHARAQLTPTTGAYTPFSTAPFLYLSPFFFTCPDSSNGRSIPPPSQPNSLPLILPSTILQLILSNHLLPTFHLPFLLSFLPPFLSFYHLSCSFSYFLSPFLQPLILLPIKSSPLLFSFFFLCYLFFLISSQDLVFLSTPLSRLFLPLSHVLSFILDTEIYSLVCRYLSSDLQSQQTTNLDLEQR